MLEDQQQKPDIRPEGKRLSLGRDSRSDIVLTDSSVAPRHAALYWNSVGLHVTAIDGVVVVNGRRIKTTGHLKNGDWLQLGKTRFKVSGDGLISPADNVSGISVSGLSVEASGRKILSDISIEITRGQFVGLLGPSGSGKSTLIRCMLGYTQPATGVISVGGYDIPNESASLWKSAGYVPQDDVLFPLLTVFENLDYSLRLREPRLTSKDRTKIIDGRLRQLALTQKANVPVRTLSGGERKRVCVAQELLTAPTFLFLDEPTAGLDPVNEARLMDELRRIADAGVIVVCATHVLESAMLLHRAVILVGGLIAFDGKPSDMLQAVGADSFRELYEESRLRKLVKSRHSQRSIAIASEKVAIRSGSHVMDVIAHTNILLSRGVLLLMRDIPWLFMLILQPVVIGLLINVSQHHPTRPESILTFAAVASVWLGLTNTAREFVKERRYYVRERLFGMSSIAYVLCKSILFASIGAVQLAIIILILRNLNALDSNALRDLVEVPALKMWVCFFAAYLGAAMIGLCVSTIAKTQEWAVAVIPLLILPQLLLTREATRMSDDGRFESAYYLYDNQGQEPRSAAEWGVELASLALQTRPCVSLMCPERPRRTDDVTPGSFHWLPHVVTILHSILLIVLPCIVLIFLVRMHEPRWLKSFGLQN